MFAETVEIGGTFDVAGARNKVRSYLTKQYRKMPVSVVYALTGLTALGELIISLQTGISIPVHLKILEEDGHYYLEYSCNINIDKIHNQGYHRYQINLEKISSELNIQNEMHNMHIVGRIQLDT